MSPSWKARLLWARRGRERAGKAVVNAFVRRGDVALDVGANFGLYTDRLARMVGREGAVYAFEPNPVYATSLARIGSTRKNVTFRPVAVSDRPGKSLLSVPANPSMGSLEDREGAHETVEVPTTTLDSELGSVLGIRLLKCDVEGHEHEVLLGGLELLRREQPVLLVEIEQRHRQRPVAETFELLSELGYEGHLLTAAGPRPLADFNLERDQLAVIADDPATDAPPPEYLNNFLFVPPWAPLSMYVRSADTGVYARLRRATSRSALMQVRRSRSGEHVGSLASLQTADDCVSLEEQVLLP